MAYNGHLADKIRQALAHIADVEEKTMFRGVTFMVNGKMCISVSGDELLCRINPEIREIVLEKNGCREMIHGKKPMKGYIFVSEEAFKTKTEFDYWINLALEFNEQAKASKKRSKNLSL